MPLTGPSARAAPRHMAAAPFPMATNVTGAEWDSSASRVSGSGSTAARAAFNTVSRVCLRLELFTLRLWLAAQVRVVAYGFHSSRARSRYRLMGENRGRTPVLFGLAALGLAIGGLMGHSGSASPPTSAPVVTEPAGRADSGVVETVTVHVSGMVRSPGVVDVPPGSIVADVIGAAGGLLPAALIDRINLASPVSAGDHIVVPGPDGLPHASTSGLDGPGGTVSLNTASVSDLEGLPGVGPVLAERIVSFREHNGPFSVVEDLLEVPGIGEAKLAALRDLVRP